MTELPEEVLKDLEDKNKAQLKHRWAFSFMPVEKTIPSSYTSGSDAGEKTAIYLVGYCAVCDTSVSSLVRISRFYTVTTEANIPKWGCVPKGEL